MENWTQKIKLSRYMLLGTAILTLLNIGFLLGNLDMYVSYCAAAPYYLVWLGKLFDNNMALGSLNGEFTATGLVMAGVLLTGLLLLWWLARDSSKWLAVGLWVIVIDLVLLLVLALAVFADPMGIFWEAVLHLAMIRGKTHQFAHNVRTLKHKQNQGKRHFDCQS